MLNSLFILFSILSVDSLKTAIQDTTILIIWTTPDDTSIDYIQVQMSCDDYPDTLGSPLAKIDSINPFETDTVICGNGLIPGVRYYFSVFTVDTSLETLSYTYDTISSPSPYPPKICSYYPDRIRTDKDIFKISFNDTMDSLSILQSVKVFSYHSNDTISDYNVSLISRVSHRNIQNYQITDTFGFYVYPRSLDTVVVHIQSDYAADIFGWKLDGNGNNVQEGSPIDDIEFRFYYAILGDFNMDGTVDIQDFNGYMRDAMFNNNTACDIGPALTSDNVPYLRKAPDGVVNIEDLGVFIQMWTWSIQHFGIKVPEGIVSSDNILSKLSGDTIRILYRGKGDFTAAEILLEGDIEKFVRGEILSPNTVMMSGKAHNLTVIDIVSPLPIHKGELLKIIGNKNIKLWIKILASDNQIISSGRIEFLPVIEKIGIDKVNIHISGIKHYKVFDCAGRRILSGCTIKNYIDLPKNIPEGIYFLKIVSPVETKSIKLIKIR